MAYRRNDEVALASARGATNGVGAPPRHPRGTSRSATLLLMAGLVAACGSPDEAGERMDPAAVQPDTAADGARGTPAVQVRDWERAAREIRHLPPSAFPDLPARVREELDRAGCLVPQTPDAPEPHNAIRGSFADPQQEDWAVLCSSGGEHRIRMVWGGPHRCPAVLAEGRLISSLQGRGDGIGYSRMLYPVEPEQIRRYHDAYGGPEPPDPLTHHGIDDVFVGKASVVWYCEDGTWLRLTGAD